VRKNLASSPVRRARRPSDSRGYTARYGSRPTATHLVRARRSARQTCHEKRRRTRRGPPGAFLDIHEQVGQGDGLPQPHAAEVAKHEGLVEVRRLDPAVRHVRRRPRAPGGKVPRAVRPAHAPRARAQVVLLVRVVVAVVVLGVGRRQLVRCRHLQPVRQRRAGLVAAVDRAVQRRAQRAGAGRVAVVVALAVARGRRQRARERGDRGQVALEGFLRRCARGEGTSPWGVSRAPNSAVRAGVASSAAPC